MNRRGFLAAPAALLITRPAGAAAASFGCVRVYRRDGDHEFREVAWEQVRAGDRIIIIGETNGTLWRCHTFTVREVVPVAGAPGEVGFVADHGMNHSDCLHPYYDEPMAQ